MHDAKVVRAWVAANPRVAALAPHPVPPTFLQETPG